MKYCITFLTSTLLMANVLVAQTLRDTSFKNVLLIDRNNITTDGKNFLIDVPVASTEKIPVTYLADQTIPALLWPMFGGDHYSFFIITPDFNGPKIDTSFSRDIKKVPHSQRSMIIYHYMRLTTLNVPARYKVDSIVVSDNFPTLHFVKTLPPTDKELDIVFSENYGSTCCPRAGIWDKKPTTTDFVQYFESVLNKDTLKIGDVYSRYTGFEGEHTNLYTLNGLTRQQQLQFLTERALYMLPDKNNGIAQLPAQLFLPLRINTSNARPGTFIKWK